MNFATIIIVLIFAGILVSLGSALVHLVRGRGRSDRTAKALTVRIGMSFALFALPLPALVGGSHTPARALSALGRAQSQ